MSSKKKKAAQEAQDAMLQEDELDFSGVCSYYFLGFLFKVLLEGTGASLTSAVASASSLASI